MKMPRVNELEAFEDDLLKMIENIDFRRTSNDLQRPLDKDIQKIKISEDVIVPADKTRNLYAVPKKKYDKLLRENITKSYKPAPDETYQEINDEARDIAASLEMSERMNCMAKKEAFITLKGEVRTINDRNICERRSCMKNNGKSPTFKFVSGEERRPSEVQRVSRNWRLPGATHSSADLTWIRK